MSQRQPETFRVLEMIAQGMSNGEICDALFKRPRTVEHQINTIYRCLGLGKSGAARRVKAVLSYLEYQRFMEM